MFQFLARTALFISAVSVLPACSYFDNFNRSPGEGALPGELVETTFSNAELEARNFQVVYRFRSGPIAVVKAGSNALWDNVERLSQSAGANSLFQLHSAESVSRAVPSRQLSYFSNISSYGAPYSEAGFSAVIPRLAQSGYALNPVRVAIIDSGVVPVSSALQKKLLKSTNLSTDTNACGWMDHGTAIASIFVGVFGGGYSECSGNSGYENLYSNAFAPNVVLHSIKIAFQNESNSVMRADLKSLQVAAAIDEAVADGADFVNLSIAYDIVQPDAGVALAERYMMANAANKGVIFVAAAGNQGKNIDGGYYPATYDLDNLIVVGAHTSRLGHLENSNFGSDVDLTAQGEGIMANTVRGSVSSFSGTSMSVPIVVSALALHKGLLPTYDYRTRVRDLLASANPSYATQGVPVGAPIARYGRLDVAAFFKNVLR